VDRMGTTARGRGLADAFRSDKRHATVLTPLTLPS
jgi:hypothetical protein